MSLQHYGLRELIATGHLGRAQQLPVICDPLFQQVVVRSLLFHGRERRLRSSSAR
jgi:hypothetical protein